MKRLTRRIVLLVLCGALAIAIVPVLKNNSISTAAKRPNLILDQTSDANLALTEPDKFNWGLLVKISQHAPDDLQTTVQLANGQKVKTNNALWETWADDFFTFPGFRKVYPPPDPQNPPKWQDRNKLPKKLEPILQQELKIQRSATAQQKLGAQVAVGGTEEVRRNQAAFDFIISRNIWYREGQKCAFSKGVDAAGYPNGVKIDFPPEAIEVKAVWKTISESDKPNYHWNYDGQGSLYGLTGLHIISKTLPNWTWVTFEWVGNPGRCDWIGCHDSFGVTPANVAPAFPQGQPYPPGTPTANLMQMFKDGGFDSDWVAQWQNYRLKGSQVDFTDITGKPVLVGNSITEEGFVQTSSCMTCHVNASVDSSGRANQSIGFTPDGQSRNGPIDPGWFSDLNTWDQAKTNYKLNYYPMDFIWAIFRAQPVAQGKPIPPCT
jgi:hypothetical protein